MFSIWLLLALGLVSICAVACLCLRLLLVEVTVEGQSMLPALEPGDRVLVLRHWPARRLRKGQIVVACLVPKQQQPAEGISHVIKRITGLAGEQITAPVHDGSRQPMGSAAGPAHRTWHIPPWHIFIQGDNPLAGTDSTTYGPISVKHILGVVVLKLSGKAGGEQVRGAGRAKLLKDGPPVGQPAPPFAAETLSGKTVTLEHYAGRGVALLFTIPSQLCAQLITDYEAIRPYAEEAGVELVLVWNDEPDQARRFVERLRPTLPVLVAPEQSNPLTKDYNIQLWPSYCLVDPWGIVRSSGYPNRQSGEWKALVESWSVSAPRTRQLVQLGLDDTRVLPPRHKDSKAW